MRQLDDLRKLRHVVGVAQAGSFTGAAKALALTQSAVTKSVADVEQMLGLTLFERLPRGVRLTPEGLAFVPRAQRLLEDAGDLLLDIRQFQNLNAGRLRIGVAPAAVSVFLESTVSAFAKVYPAVSVEVVDAPLDDVAGAASRGDLDLVVGNVGLLETFPALEVQSIAPLNVFFISRQNHPLLLADETEPQPISAAQLLAYPVVLMPGGLWLQEELRRAYLDAGLAPVPPQYLCSQFALVKEIVAATNAIAPVTSLHQPSDAFQGRFHIYLDTIKLSPQELGVAYAGARQASPALRAFIDIFRGFLQDSLR